jgi:anti-sigma factor ChrR (cupin superfamily)
MEPEQAIFCNQARVEAEIATQLRNVGPTTVLPTSYAGAMVAQRLWEYPTSRLSNLRLTQQDVAHI